MFKKILEWAFKEQRLLFQIQLEIQDSNGWRDSNIYKNINFPGTFHSSHD